MKAQAPSSLLLCILFVLHCVAYRAPRSIPLKRGQRAPPLSSSSSSQTVITQSQAPLAVFPHKSLLPLLLNAGYSLASLGGIASGLEAWSAALLQGVLPGDDADQVVRWPTDPTLVDSIRQTFSKLDLPRMVQRHPVLLPSVLKSIVELASEFQRKVEQEEKRQEQEEKQKTEKKEWEEEEEEEEEDGGAPPPTGAQRLQAYKETLSAALARKLENQWAPPLGGLSMLDEIYGRDHDLLSVSDDSQDGIDGGGGSGAGGFGLSDGVWKSDGWRVMQTLQDRLKEMKELHLLMDSLGRRPSAAGKSTKKTPPQQQDPRAPLGVCCDSLVRDELTGVRRANSFEMLLPSETMLLSPRSAARSRRPKLLFLSKFAESRLQSYEMTGWIDSFSRPKRKPWRHFNRLPVTTGGPIILCLDTSYSMAGPREQLAKAVVLAAATLGARDNRPLYLLAFSGSQNLAECQLQLGADKRSLSTLLQFLSSSFCGGTDVTTPLARAVELLEDTTEWASADVLVVTDGELMNPPLPDILMEKIKHLEKERGLEVHGLLVGNRDPSPALRSICTEWDGIDRVHDFLSSYDPLLKLLRASAEAEEGIEKRDEEEKEEEEEEDEWASSKQSPSRGRSTKQARQGRSCTSLAMLPEHQEDEREGQMTGAGGLEPLLSDIIARLGAGLIERDTEVRLLLLAVLCREHIILLGPPGTGKSELARRMGSLTGGIFFERLLTKFTAPEELFGPLSLQALEQDKYVRNTEGYLPSSSICFLDEIFKSSSSILNSFLTILQERLYDNGTKRVKVPLLAVVAASNELPDSEELDALYDRFLFRRMVSPISDAQVHRLLTASNLETAASASVSAASGQEPLVSEALAERIVKESDAVALPPHINHLLIGIRTHLRDGINPPIYVSDRRLKKAAKALRVSAYCQGRSSVGLTDVLLLRHMLWYQPEDEEKIADWLFANLVPEPDTASLSYLANAVLRRLTSALSSGSVDSLETEKAELAALRSVIDDKLQEAAATTKELAESNLSLFLDPTTALRAQQQLSPPALAAVESYTRCRDAMVFLQQELALSNMASESALSNAADSVDAVAFSKPWRAAFSVPEAESSEEDAEAEDQGRSRSRRGVEVPLSKDQLKAWRKKQAKGN